MTLGYMLFLNVSVEQSCCIICVNDCEAGLESLWKCSYTCKIMYHLNSLLIKHWLPSQRSRLNSRRGKHPWILFWYSLTVLVIEYRRTCRSCISVKILASPYIEPNLGRGRRVGMGRRGDMNKSFAQEGFLINSEVQNSRKFCPGRILRQESSTI